MLKCSMTVEQLIEELKKVKNKHAQVCFFYTDYCDPDDSMGSTVESDIRKVTDLDDKCLLSSW